MKDFEFENTMNENGNVQNETTETTETTEATEPSDALETNEQIVSAARETAETVENTTDDVEDILRHAQEASNPQPIRNAQPQPVRPAPQSAQGTYSPYPNGTYRPQQQNPYNAAGTAPNQAYQRYQNTNPQYTAYRPANGSTGNAYSPAANGYNPQNRSYNAYGATADPQTAQIAYTPAPKQKTKKSGSVKAVAIICACAVILSGLAGFGGTVLGNRLTAKNNVTVTEATDTAQKNPAAAPTSGDSVVIYKSVDVDNVTTSTSTTAGSDLTYAQVAALVKDSVVEINTEFTVRGYWQYNASGAGSGVIISEDGYLITNAHVIVNESTGKPAETITVRLTNGEEFPAEVVTYDSDEDIAILKIAATGLTPARCGDSDRLTVGEELIVVGNPLGELGGSVSNGIVSATQREIEIGGVTMYLIQTNAAVNPGNSGGGMFNMKGELVGIVNCKSYGEEIEGLGFAIPINQALKISEELLTKGYVSGKPMLGISLDSVSSNSFFSFYSIRSGLYVTAVEEGMNDKVFQVGDRIIAVDGEEITASEDVKAIIYKHAVGDKIKVQLYRNNKLMEVEATLYERVPTADQSGSFGAADVQGSLNDFFGGNN
ncbi:MAG: trypsin-like peptidase domain-containing protein [Clostridia bacterium]|nr:trypsin-like peptidase domain-containing protein [Clostridia bacterium]